MDFKLFQKIEVNFINHLDAERNERILYSGKFGVGKSTFLRHFFEKNKAKYNCIHLYPVNYSILSNEDIFTYLKFDILFHLLTDKGIVLEKAEKYGLDVALPYFLKNNWFRFLSLIPHLFDKVGGVIPGKGIAEIMKGCGELYKEYQEFANRKDGELDEFDRFQMEIMNKEGGLYESNALTNIIRSELSDIKTATGRENILIIDDLDRLDPDHIFRLLNVFSAHFDERHRTEADISSNKYGFDKIILVCDNENIRNIFKAKYGIDTDYNGYIDKFYSREIFEHSVSDLVDIFSLQVLKSLKTNKGEITKGNYKISTLPYFKAVIEVLLQQNLMNLRTLFRYSKDDLDISSKNTNLNSMDGVTRHNIDSIIILDVLSIIYGSKVNMKLILKKLNGDGFYETFRNENEIKARILGELIYLNGNKNEKWINQNNNKSESSYNFENKEYKVTKTICSDRIVFFSLEPHLAQSLDLNYLSLFKKYGLEKYS